MTGLRARIGVVTVLARRASVRRRISAGLLAVALLAAGCPAPPTGPDPVEPLTPRWEPVALPLPPGWPGRLMVRDAVACAGPWYLVGAVAGAGDATRPAAWTSMDGRTWTALRLTPTSYYGERAILYAAGCLAGRIAVIGAKAGGAHGNPRVRTWQPAPDGSLVEVSAEFELYGGPTAVSVSRLAGGPLGWLIAGSRSSGAAVWHSPPDAAGFEIVEQAPGLAGDAATATAATDALAVPGGWLVGGSGRDAHRADRDPLVWTSPDGRTWRRVALPATGADEAVHRLVAFGDELLALGPRGGVFGAWRAGPVPSRASGGTSAPSEAASPSAGVASPPVGMPGTASSGPAVPTDWRAAGSFGATGGGVVAGVESVAVAGGRVLALTVAADGHRLWWSDPTGGRWAPVTLPVVAPAGGDTAAAVAAMEGKILLSVDIGAGAAVWLVGGSRTG